jgi:curved DNA-binding protein CbpA
MIRDPYQTLGVTHGASDQEIRSAYRRLVQLHHPDHNGGSQESERRFEEVQEAYAQIRELRKAGAGARPRTASQPPPPPPRFDDDVEARAAALERELRRAHEARERARQAAREAAAATARRPDRPTDEELGYVETEDSFSKILADARTELSDRFSDAREHPVVRRVSNLIDELDDLASKLTGK